MASLEKSDLLKEYNFDEEFIEIARDNAGNFVEGFTGYPKPIQSYRFILEDFNKPAEEIYYWITDCIMVGEGFPFVKKISDLFSASENSSFFGNAQQRLGMQQEKVSMFMGTIGKMVKELFQIVRELRIIDERFGYYEDSMNKDSKTRESAEIVLKGLWIDQVEGGSKNPASVYGMARELQFTTLPDIFFATHPVTLEEIDSIVNGLEFNIKVKEVLKRKLRTFMQWKFSTYKEIKNRKIFTLRYLRQHFNSIRMYISWVKPYMRNLRRLTLQDRTDEVDMISSFEGSITEIENLFYKLPPSHGDSKYMFHNKHIYSVVLINFRYRLKPSMNFQTEYQRGPMHIGKAEVNIRAYAWNKETIDKYVKMRQKEDLDLIGNVDSSLKAAMESLGEELEKYLKEAEDNFEFTKKDKEETKPKKSLKDTDPFVALLYGFKDIFYEPFFSSTKTTQKNQPNKVVIDNETKIATGNAVRASWQVYKNFKKNNKMLAW
ncbi:MAG: hypothetical protein ACOC3X_01905 [Nanoarchaeota archaeon]